MQSKKSIRDTKLFETEYKESEIPTAWLDHYKNYQSMLVDFLISSKKQKDQTISKIITTVNIYLNFAKSYECLYVVVLLHPYILKYVQSTSLATYIIFLKSKSDKELNQALLILKQKCNNIKLNTTLDLAKFYSNFSNEYDVNEMHIYTTLAFAGNNINEVNEFLDIMYKKAKKLMQLDLAPVYFGLYIKSYDKIKKRNAYNQFLKELKSIKKTF